MTLALMFPKEKKIEQWYRRKGRAGQLDFLALNAGRPVRSIESYSYWRDRLVLLKEAFDDARPRTLLQLWHDRRDTAKWLDTTGVYIAIGLTLLFGLLQSIEGALQVYAAFRMDSKSP
jgi:hypothetical protein